MTDEKKIECIDYQGIDLTERRFENCTFDGCNFSHSDFANTAFVDCRFYNCNFSMARMRNTSLREVKFRNCKLLGLNFNECNCSQLVVEFEDCIINMASFLKLKLCNTRFRNCCLKEVDFTGTDLSSSVFDNCDFTKAVFERTVLEQTDMRTSYNFAIDPEHNELRRAKFSTTGLVGLLLKYGIDVE